MTTDTAGESTNEVSLADSLAGKDLFDHETFGGNGRTCLTCHSKDTGTFSPEDAQQRLAADPSDPLFIQDGTDDGVSGTTRITTHATIRITLPLPPFVTLADDPGATSVVLNRGVPTTRNVPSFDHVFMYDGRNLTLEDQALGAIHAHAQNTVEPTAQQLSDIADFEKNTQGNRFFSSDALRKYAEGGPPPVLPEGTTDSEKRGRAMFDDAPFSPPSKQGICALCHSGPLLNTTNKFLGPITGGAPAGLHFFTAAVSERNKMGNPLHTWVINNGFNVVTIVSPDIGVVLTNPKPPEFPPFFPHSFGANQFKIPTVWGVKATAPYFHDNSAKTLAEVAEQYAFLFGVILHNPLSAQDREDVVAFMNLLGGDEE